MTQSQTLDVTDFLILNIKNYTFLKTVDDHEDYISINKIDKIINNLDIRKIPDID